VKLDKWSDRNLGRRPNAPRLRLRTLGRAESRNVYPELSTAWKAMSVRILLFFLASFTANLACTTHFEQLISTHLWALADFTWTLCNASMVMTTYEKHRALHAGNIYLLTQQALTVFAKKASIYLFRVRPKHHYLSHILLTLQRSKLNPRIWTTCRKESMLFKLKRIGKHVSPQRVGKTLLHRYWVHMESRFRIRKQTKQFNPRPSWKY